MNKLKKASGIIKAIIKIPNFTSKLFDEQEIFFGAICLNYNKENIICTNYIPGIISAHYFSYKELYTLFGFNSSEKETIENDIDWHKSHPLIITKMSKLWDYIHFDFNLDNNTELSIMPDFINFFKINKISAKFDINTDYKIYAIPRAIEIRKKFQNLLHEQKNSPIGHNYYMSQLMEQYDTCKYIIESSINGELKMMCLNKLFASGYIPTKRYRIYEVY